MVWHVATLTRVRAEDFPDLDKVCGEQPPPKTMSPDQMMMNMRAIQATALAAQEARK